MRCKPASPRTAGLYKELIRLGLAGSTGLEPAASGVTGLRLTHPKKPCTPVVAGDEAETEPPQCRGEHVPTDLDGDVRMPVFHVAHQPAGRTRFNRRRV